jgi:tRNA (guanine37-N1)-methyltransferase
MMRFDILTIFPDIFDSYLDESLFKRARKKKVVVVKTHDIRAFTNDRHQKVDDRPFGGGPGMVLKIQPIYTAVKKIQRSSLKISKTKKATSRIILFSTRGKKFDATAAKRLAKYDNLIFICGRYEGVDERVAQYIADEEISIGDYVLSGGELAALVVMEGVSRQISGFLGKEESLEEINGSFPTYTRPEVFSPAKGKEWKVPDVLLSGNHKNIEAWRKESGSNGKSAAGKK